MSLLLLLLSFARKPYNHELLNWFFWRHFSTYFYVVTPGVIDKTPFAWPAIDHIRLYIFRNVFIIMWNQIPNISWQIKTFLNKWNDNVSTVAIFCYLCDVILNVFHQRRYNARNMNSVPSLGTKYTSKEHKIHLQLKMIALRRRRTTLNGWTTLRCSLTVSWGRQIFINLKIHKIWNVLKLKITAAVWKHP